MTTVFLSLGSNEGNRESWLQQGIVSLGLHCGTIIRQSSVYQTAAWGLEDQPDFLNMVIKMETDLSPEQLLEAIQVIEKELGRQRIIKWGQRTLDIDILFYGEWVIDTENLTIPHPYIQERRFTLAPLQEIAADFVHPVFKLTIAELLEDCKDPLEARRVGS